MALCFPTKENTMLFQRCRWHISDEKHWNRKDLQEGKSSSDSYARMRGLKLYGSIRV